MPRLHSVLIRDLSSADLMLGNMVKQLKETLEDVELPEEAAVKMLHARVALEEARKHVRIQMNVKANTPVRD